MTEQEKSDPLIQVTVCAGLTVVSYNTKTILSVKITELWTRHYRFFSGTLNMFWYIYITLLKQVTTIQSIYLAGF